MESPVWHSPAEPRWLELRAVMRREVDNALDLIHLLEVAPAPIMKLASAEADEDVFLIGPDLQDQLRKKVKIMLDHEEDINRLAVRFN